MAALRADKTITRVVDFRGTVGLSQVAFAERIGISRPTLAKIEGGSPTKHSTINYLVSQLQEEFGEQFEVIRLADTGPNSFALEFEKRDAGRVEHLRPVPTWTAELNALSRKIAELGNKKNVAHLGEFHDQLVEILETSASLSGRSIHIEN